MTKTILVTGANRGIGREISIELSKRGHRIIVAARSLDKALKTSNALDGESIPLALDISNPDSISEAAVSLRSSIDCLDVLINNAGVISSGDLFSNSVEHTIDILQTNYLGSLRTSLEFSPLLSNSRDARIINISSGMGSLKDLENGDYSAYRLSKANLNALTVLLNADGRSLGIKAFSMCPGWVRTDMGGTGASRSVEKGAETAVWLSESQ